jgi:hypothetical protein
MVQRHAQLNSFQSQQQQQQQQMRVTCEWQAQSDWLCLHFHTLVLAEVCPVCAVPSCSTCCSEDDIEDIHKVRAAAAVAAAAAAAAAAAVLRKLSNTHAMRGGISRLSLKYITVLAVEAG